MVDIGGNTLQSLVDFCYTAEITINEDNVQAILPAACLLQIHEVQNVCCDFLKKQLDVTNCLGIRAFADTHSCRDLFKTAEKYVLDNFQVIFLVFAKLKLHFWFVFRKSSERMSFFN